MGRTRERDAKIEFIRVLACVLVVWNHILIVPTSGDGHFYDATAFLVSVIWTDVPLFLLISGFLMFQGVWERPDSLWVTYKHRLINLVLYVGIPSCIIVFASGLLEPFLNGEATLLQVLAGKDFRLDYIKNYILIQQTRSVYSVFWYIWVYARIVVFFPFLALICQNTPDRNRIRRFIMVLSALNLLLSDVQGAAQKSIANFDNLTVDKYFLYILLGYEVYVLVKEHKSVHNRQLTIAGAAVFFGSCIGTVLTGHICFAATGESYMPQILTMSASAGLFLLLVTAVKPRHTKLWNYLGCRTLYIYMVHIIVIFSCEQVWGDFFWKMFGSCQNVLWQLAYGIVYGTIIFLISLLLGNLFRFIYEKLLLGMALKATKSIFDRQKGIR